MIIYWWACLERGQLPLALVCGLLCLLQLLQSRCQPLLSSVQLFLHQLDTSVQGGHLSLSLPTVKKDGQRRVYAFNDSWWFKIESKITVCHLQQTNGWLTCLLFPQVEKKQKFASFEFSLKVNFNGGKRLTENLIIDANQALDVLNTRRSILSLSKHLYWHFNFQKTFIKS